MKRLIIWLIGLIALAAKGDAVTVTGPQAGVNAATGERPFRQELSVLQNSGPAFDLYIQALYYFMQDDQSNVESYFQIAGKCHPVPHSPLSQLNNIKWSQRFMGFPTDPGTASRGISREVTVPMDQPCFLPGIGRIWPSLRSVPRLVPLAANVLNP